MTLNRVLEELVSTDKFGLKVQVGRSMSTYLNFRTFTLTDLLCGINTQRSEQHNQIKGQMREEKMVSKKNVERCVVCF